MCPRDDDPPNPVPTDADTVAADTGDPGTTPTVAAAGAAPVAIAPSGYDVGKLLGSGGMGDVLLAHDRRIGRDVAIKRMNVPDRSGAMTARFLREAKVQARLEHPTIVPVYELGSDPEGKPYFTMKRLTGVTLQQLLADGEPQQRLLRAFHDVCSAIEFAHSRGVVHRDLKPPNIMLGDFGEVYVLDWGVARVIGETPIAVEGEDVTTLDGQTQIGAVLGTPGYMAPEQVAGEPAGPAADVYALGAILFEILAGVSLHPRGTKAMASTVSRPTEAPSTRKPEATIAPELDAVVVAALAADPERRITAQELADRVQAYLDGDRDLEHRRALADKQLAAARVLIDSDDPLKRPEALQLAARALALAPESIEAAQLVSSLILEPPQAIPPDLAASLDAADRDASRHRSKKAMIAFLIPLSFLVLVPWLEIRSWPALIGFFASLIGPAILAYLSYRRGRMIVPLALTATLIAIVLFSRLASPFVLTPVFTAGIIASLAATSWMQRHAWVIVAWTILAVLIPLGLEFVVFDRTWWYAGDQLAIRSAVMRNVHGWLEPAALVMANILFISIVGLFARAITRNQHDAERSLHVQAWHLRQLLPQQR